MNTTWVTAFLTVFGVLLGYVVHWLQAHPDVATRLETAMNIAGIVVRAVEQIGAVYGWDGEKKKDEAVKRMIDLAKANGIYVTAAEVDTLVEGAVAALKRAGAELHAPSAAPAPSTPDQQG